MATHAPVKRKLKIKLGGQFIHQAAGMTLVRAHICVYDEQCQLYPCITGGIRALSSPVTVPTPGLQSCLSKVSLLCICNSHSTCGVWLHHKTLSALVQGNPQMERPLVRPIKLPLPVLQTVVLQVPQLTHVSTPLAASKCCSLLALVTCSTDKYVCVYQCSGHAQQDGDWQAVQGTAAHGTSAPELD